MSKYSNRKTELFADLLEIMEFDLHKDDDGYYLVDLQGGNFGDIESDRFNNSNAIIDRLDVYIDDYFLRDLEEAAVNYQYFDNHKIPSSAEEWAELPNKTNSIQKFVREYSCEFEAMKAISQGFDDVILDEVVV